jgi:uncharacterized protein (DUF2252 family)
MGRSARRAVGVEARARVPHALHGRWAPDPDRPDPIALLAHQAESRIPQLVPLRHARMAVSPFTFDRGAAVVMAADLAPTPVSGITVQLCGDAHLSNFGLFASPERDLVFDLNDFDETLPGPWEWDVKRLAASLVLAARFLGADGSAAHKAASSAVHAYQKHMADYAGMRAIDVFYARVDATEILDDVSKGSRAFVASTVHAAAHHDALHALPHLTAPGPDGSIRIVDRPPTIYHDPAITPPTERVVMDAYAETVQEDRRVLLHRYGLVDAAVKVVGVGSVGLAAAVALLDAGDGRDPLFLQVKEAEASVLEAHLAPSAHAHHGERVVAGQRRLQAASDVLLGWTTGPRGRHLYLRQLQDQKAGAVIEGMSIEDLRQWGKLCGWALARGHARSGDPVAIDAYLGDGEGFAHAVADFAVAYADQTVIDHAALVAAIADGRLAAAAPGS